MTVHHVLCPNCKKTFDITDYVNSEIMKGREKFIQKLVEIENRITKLEEGIK